MHSKNEVYIGPHCKDQVEVIKGRLCHFANEVDAFLSALQETLKAEVRSRFETNKQMEFTEHGQLVSVLFDETVVRYRWVAARKFEVISITLAAMDKTLSETLKVLNDEADPSLADESILDGGLIEAGGEEAE